MHTNERKYHYWRGFIVGATLVILIMFTATVIIKALILSNPPDYTMTPAQYHEYIYYCTSQ